jgi:hypothetical protein
MPPADSCTAAHQSQAQKRSIVQWRSGFSTGTALWSANVGFEMAGGAGAGGEGTSSGEDGKALLACTLLRLQN